MVPFKLSLRTEKRVGDIYLNIGGTNSPSAMFFNHDEMLYQTLFSSCNCFHLKSIMNYV